MSTKAEYERRKVKALEEAKTAPAEKACTKCGEVKPLSDYSNLCVGKYGKHPQCKICVQAYHSGLYYSNEDYRSNRIKDASIRNRKSKYNITEEEFNRLFKSQNYCCAICDVHLDNSRFGLRGQLDHCHETMKIRGILCANCNTALGLMKDNKEILMSAIQYLDKD